VIAGLQDNGTKAMISNTWKGVIGGDGMECLIDYTNTNVQYGELYYGDIYRTDNRWGSSAYITGSLTGNAGWVTPYVIDPNNNSTLYVGYQDVWKTTNKGASWSKISAWAGPALQSLAVAPSGSGTIYVATTSILYRTTDGGTTWTNVTGTLPVGSNNITYLSVKQDDPNTLWVSLGQFNAYGVFQSTNGGVTWTNISGGLPSIPVNCVIQNRQSTSQVELYAGTDVGVFIKLGDAAWVPWFTGLPNVVVMELEIYYAADPAQSRIRAATYGRGLWESDVYGGVVVNSPPVISPDPLIEAGATTGSAYSATLADHAADPNTGDVLAFTRLSGPAWLTVAGNGALSGIPATGDIGINSFDVKVEDGKGGSDQAVLQIMVSPVVTRVPVANFSANPVTVTVGQTVQFTDLSINSPTGWSWDFGDGQISVLQNPSITYINAGLYAVALTVTNSAGSDVKTKNEFITVVAANSPPEFTANPVVETGATAGTAYSSTLADHASDPNTGDVLAFSKLSGPAWLSVAGNGALSGTPATGDTGINSFTVKVDDGKGGSGQAVLQITVSGMVTPVPVADFSANPVTVKVEQTVQFTDLSQNAPTGWSWDFGDGKTSALQNPSNVYSTAGKYTVILTATNSAGSNAKTGYISVSDISVAKYCTPTGINNSKDYINTLTIGGITSTTGKGSSGYLLYTSPVFSLAAGKSSPVSLTPFNTRNSDYWKIWIDFNMDGDFTDASENVLNITNKKGVTTGSILIPSTASGLTRMRIAMKTGATMNPCDNKYNGEVEDYCVNILRSGSIEEGGDIISGGDASGPVLKLYPNPATSQLNISVESTTGNGILRVFNILGSQLDQIRADSNLIQLDLARYSRGVYYILLEDQNQRVVQKFIKE